MRPQQPCPAHRGHPPRIDHAGETPAWSPPTACGCGSHVRSGVVADMGGRCLAVSARTVATAVILEVVVGSAMSCSRVSVMAATAIRRYPGGSCRRSPRGHPGRAAGDPAPRQCTWARSASRSCSCPDQLQQPGIGSRFGSENPCGGSPLISVVGQIRLGVRAHVVVLGGLVEVGDNRTASSSMVTTCGKASRKSRIRTVTSMRGRPQLGRLHGRQVDDPPRASSEPPAAQALRRCRRRRASPRCPTPTAPPTAATAHTHRGSYQQRVTSATPASHASRDASSTE